MSTWMTSNAAQSLTSTSERGCTTWYCSHTLPCKFNNDSAAFRLPVFIHRATIVLQAEKTLLDLKVVESTKYHAMLKEDHAVALRKRDFDRAESILAQMRDLDKAAQKSDGAGQLRPSVLGVLKLGETTGRHKHTWLALYFVNCMMMPCFCLTLCTSCCRRAGDRKLQEGALDPRLGFSERFAGNRADRWRWTARGS